MKDVAEVIEQQAQQTPNVKWRRRARLFLVVLFAFLAVEGVLFALALQGPWLVLLAPGVVCGIKAAETYKQR